MLGKLADADGIGLFLCDGAEDGGQGQYQAGQEAQHFQGLFHGSVHPFVFPQVRKFDLMVTVLCLSWNRGNKNAPSNDRCLRRNVRGATQFPLHGGELSVAYHHTRRQDNGCGSRQRLRPCSFRRRPRKSIRRLLLCRGPTARGSLCQPVLAVTTLPQRFDGGIINPVRQIVNRENCFGNVFVPER